MYDLVYICTVKKYSCMDGITTIAWFFFVLEKLVLFPLHTFFYILSQKYHETATLAATCVHAHTYTFTQQLAHCAYSCTRAWKSTLAPPIN